MNSIGVYPRVRTDTGETEDGSQAGAGGLGPVTQLSPTQRQKGMSRSEPRNCGPKEAV